MFCEISSFAQNSEPMTDYSTMIRENVEELYRFLEETVSDSDMNRIKDAFELALDAHKNQYRKSGLPYIIHPIAVALIVAKELELGPNPIIAALLHDVDDRKISPDTYESQANTREFLTSNGMDENTLPDLRHGMLSSLIKGIFRNKKHT